MRKAMVLAAISHSLVLVAALAGAEEALDFSDETTRINYSLGYQIGGDFQRQGVEMNAEAVVRGIHDALAGADPRMSEKEMNATLVELKRRVVDDARRRQQERAEKMRRAGLAFLERNKDEEGVKTTASGLQYKVLEAGSGTSPSSEDTVTVHYRGRLISGQPFDSSYQRGEPATFRLDKVIKGWAEGLQLMQEGAKYELYIPPDLAYDKQGPLANQTLIFEIELLAVKSTGASATR